MNGDTGPGTFPFIHSTNLKDGTVVLRGTRRAIHKKLMRGPAVLLPRVGQPQLKKIAVYSLRNPVVLSDCVVAISCENTAQAKKVRSVLSGGWAKVRGHYGGTCAPYITLASVRAVLEEFGFKVTEFGNTPSQ